MILSDIDFLMHTGSHKTGSSSIQRALCATEDLLLSEEPATLYPVQGRPQTAHFPVAHNFTHNAGAETAAAFEDLTDAVHAFEGKALISAESFDMAPPEAVAEAFGAALPDHRIGVIRYVRPFGSRLLSQWNQRFKKFWGVPPLREFLAHAVNGSVAQNLDGWNRAFPGRFFVRPFTPSALRDGDVVQDFFYQVFGASHAAAAEALTLPRANPSIDAAVLLLVERAKPKIEAALQEGGADRPPEGKLLRLMRSLAERHCEGSKAKLRLSHDLAVALQRSSAGAAKSVDQTYFDAPYFSDHLEETVANTPPGTELLTAEEALGLSGEEVDRIVDDIVGSVLSRVLRGGRRRHASAG